MKKIIMAVISILIPILNAAAGYAAPGAVENPKIRVVIEGRHHTFSNNPVTVNHRTMLPLREILTNLGIPNDNILWNDSDKSVTAVKDGTRIFLKVGSKSAVINDKPTELDAAPVNFNNRVFIPVRFVADSLGKKVVWDEATKTVLIRDPAEFDRTREILDMAKASMESIKKYKFDMESDFVIASKAIEMKGDGEVDLTKGIMHMNTSVVVSEKETRTETYLARSNLFIKMSPEAKWQKKNLTREQSERLLNNRILLSERMDMLAAGLVIQQDAAPHVITLKGDVFIDDLLQQSSEAVSVYGVQFSKMNLELSLDNNTHVINNATVNMEGVVKSAAASHGVTERISCKYRDFDSDFDILLSEELK